jgi:hypothetical protein
MISTKKEEPILSFLDSKKIKDSEKDAEKRKMDN